MTSANPTKCSYFLLGALLSVTRSASATGAGPPDMAGLFAIFVVIVSIVPLLLLEWAISRVKVGKKGWYLTLPAIVFMLMLVGSFIAANYQGAFLNIDGAVLTAFLVWTAYRLFVFRSRSRR